MVLINSVKTFITLLFLLAVSACSKSKFLDAIADQAVLIPETLDDLQSIMDNDMVMNGAAGVAGVVPLIGEAGADNYFYNPANWSSYPEQRIRVYEWAKEVFVDPEIVDWSHPYRAVFYANLVLEYLQKIPVETRDLEKANNIKGQALFARAHMFYQLAQVFAQPYDENNSAQAPGIPLRIKSDINEVLYRASLQETYDKILEDLMEAIPLLPEWPLRVTRASKAAAYGLLARVFLSMRKYEDALTWADSALAIQNELMEYSTLSAAMFPIPFGNKEVIYHCLLNFNMSSKGLLLAVGLSEVDSTLYKSYDDNDLRKQRFFYTVQGKRYFTGTYSQAQDLFGGIATDELYLVKAECLARGGETTLAMSALNHLLRTRWVPNTFNDLQAASADEALAIILTERRKELIFRGLRWTDIRRLNLEGADISITRIAGSDTITLAPHDPRFTYPIPPEVMAYHPTMAQNER